MPIDPMPWEQEEVVAVATKLTGPLTVLLLAGELMYTPAKAGAQGSNKDRNSRKCLDMHTSPNKIFSFRTEVRVELTLAASWRRRVEEFLEEWRKLPTG